MKVLIFHGYLLRGTGSNVYNANLAQALARLGHDVHLLCQDLEAASLPWVDAYGHWRDGSLVVEQSGAEPTVGGKITAYTPDISGLLPTYVADTYEGFRSKTFQDLDDHELERYLDANVHAVRDVTEHAGGVDAALANHLIMGPVILARAGQRFAAKVHGSALSYTVIPYPQFLPYAREGMEAAEAVLVGSHHTAASLWETVQLEGLEEKTRLGPPGVDIEAFTPLGPGEDARSELETLAAGIASASVQAAASDSGFGRDPELAVSGLRAYAAGEGPRVIFVGKLIVSKGCDLLVAAWPLVAARNPGAKLLLVGFGEYHETLKRLWSSIATGDFDDVREIAASGRAFEGGEAGALRYLTAFLEDLPDGYAAAAAAAADSVDLAGRLEYGEVAHAVRASDAMVVPSTFPEAFGMVAAEAAGAGALPVCAHHSGLAEVAGTLAESLPSELADLTSFDLGPDAIPEIAERLNRWLALPVPLREAASADLVAVVRGRWSWEGVAKSVVAASGGNLEALHPVPRG